MLSKKTILFVEDEPDIISMYHMIFDNHGYRFLSTADIEEAMTIAQAESLTAILLDIILPKKTGGTVDIAAKQGFEYLELVKNNPKTKNIPVIILTNLNTAADRKKAKDLGAIDYLVKADYTPQQIFQKVERLIKKN